MNTKISLIILTISLLFYKPIPVHAQIGCGLGPIGDFVCNLTGTKEENTTLVGNKLDSVISVIIAVLATIAGVWFLFQIIVAGLGWLGSGGEKASLEQSRNKITWAFIGLITVVGAWAVAGLIGKIVGIDIMHPGAALGKILTL